MIMMMMMITLPRGWGVSGWYLTAVGSTRREGSSTSLQTADDLSTLITHRHTHQHQLKFISQQAGRRRGSLIGMLHAVQPCCPRTDSRQMQTATDMMYDNKGRL